MTSFKLNIIVLFALTLNIEINAQEPIFAQFHNNPIYLNPALSGQYRFRASFNNNNQWFNIPGQFNTQFFSVDGILEGKSFSSNNFRSSKNLLNSGNLIGGLYFLRNSEGELSLNTNNLSIVVGYTNKFEIKKNHKLSFSMPMQFNLISKKIDFSNAIFMQNLDPVYGNINSNNFVAPYSNQFIYPTFSTGLNINLANHHQNSLATYKIDVGFSIGNILLNDVSGFLNSNTINKKKFTFYSTFYSKEFFLTKSSLFYQKHSVHETIQIFSELKYHRFNNFIFGLMYRHQFFSSNRTSNPSSSNASSNLHNPNFPNHSYHPKHGYESIHIVPTFIIRNGDLPMRIAYSYGFTLSELGHSNSFGINEISLQVVLDKENKWEFCPGDKVYRRKLNRKQKKIRK